MLLLRKLLGEVPYVYAKGGGKSAPPPQAPVVAPVAPIEESSVEIDDDMDNKKKIKSGKSELKLPLANTANTGLKV